MKYRYLAIAVLALPLLVGCSSEKKAAPEPEMKEIPTTEGEAINAPEGQLVFLGKKYYETEMYREAQDNFRALMTNYPLSPYAEFAEIKNADCIFDTSDFILAAQAYEEFLRAHPASDAAPYVLYRAARSNQLAHKGLGRDIATLEKAVKYFDELAQKYPDSNYALTARELRAEAHQSLSDYEESVAAFYQRQGKTKAAEARMQVAEQKWAPVIAKDQEELRLVEERRKEQIVVASKQAYSAAPLVSKPLAAPEPRTKLVEAPIPDAKYRIFKLECRSGSPGQIFFYLDRDFEGPASDWAAKNQNLTPSDGALSVQFPEAASRDQTVDCFGRGDLTLSQGAKLMLKTEHPAQLAVLSNPPRVLIIMNE